MERWNSGMLISKGSFPFINFPVKRVFANRPMIRCPRTQYSIIDFSHLQEAFF
jgi:hypothetical protein